MKSFPSLLAALALGSALVGPVALHAQVPATPAPRVASTGGNSPHETTSAVIGDRKTGNRVTVTYGRPFSRSPKTGEVRKIWGELVKWDKADRLGADEATLLLTQQPIQFGDTVIPAGAYTLYIVPAKNGASKLAFSSNLGKWGVPVDEAHDVARVPLEESTLPQSVDQLTIAVVNQTDVGGGALEISWETTKFTARFTVKK